MAAGCDAALPEPAPAMTRRTIRPRGFRSLAQAVERHYAELHRFVARRTGSASMADDVIQETWIRASTAGVAMPDNPRAYLFRMAGNLAVDHMRRGRPQDTPLDGASDGTVPERALVSPEPGPDAVVGAREELAILAEAVRELPEKCRIVFLLYRGQGLTMREIAARLQISEKTVEKHIARAMVHCRARLQAARRQV